MSVHDSLSHSSSATHFWSVMTKFMAEVMNCEIYITDFPHHEPNVTSGPAVMVWKNHQNMSDCLSVCLSVCLAEGPSACFMFASGVVLSEGYVICAWRAWHLPWRRLDGGRISYFARWSRRRAAPTYVLHTLQHDLRFVTWKCDCNWLNMVSWSLSVSTDV